MGCNGCNGCNCCNCCNGCNGCNGRNGCNVLIVVMVEMVVMVVMLAIFNPVKSLGPGNFLGSVKILGPVVYSDCHSINIGALARCCCPG